MSSLRKSDICLFVCLFVFYGISTFVDYLMPNQFLYKWTVLFQANQLNMSIVVKIVKIVKNIPISSYSV